MRPQTRERLAGRWVSKAAGENAMEYMFFDGNYFSYQPGEFGRAAGFMDLEQKYQTVENDPGMLKVTTGKLKEFFPAQYIRYKFDGETLVMETRNKPFKEISPKNAIRLTRPRAARNK